MRAIDGVSLWIGHVGDFRDPSGVLDAAIRAIVDLAGNEPPAMLPRDLVSLRFPLLDGSGNSPWLIRLAVDSVASLIKSDVSALVACGAGSSRSPAIAGAALAIVRGISFDEGLRFVTRSGPVDVSPALWSDVVAACS